MTKDKVPQHVKDQRAAAAAGRTVGKRTKQLRHHRERSESYDVFRRINMHNGDKDVCWEWLGAHGTGTRGEVRPRVCIDKRHYYVYRVVYELYTGYKLQEREVVRHVCDNSWCCNPYHMLIGSQADNVDDMLQRERVGLKHYQIRRIMQALEVGCTATDVCVMMKQGYNLSLDESVVRKIRMRVIYRHIDWPWGDAYANARKRRLAELRNQRLASDPKSAIISDSQQGATTHGEETEHEDD